jgi:hypothetical protein
MKTEETIKVGTEVAEAAAEASVETAGRAEEARASGSRTAERVAQAITEAGARTEEAAAIALKATEAAEAEMAKEAPAKTPLAAGKLYRSSDGQFLANVSYQFQQESPKRWWGELTLIEYVPLDDGSDYVLELEDKRKNQCTLKKRVNVAVTSVPPRYVYRFSGTGRFR